MFKRFFMISVLVSAYSFSFDELTARKNKLKKSIDESYSRASKSFVRGFSQGFLGCCCLNAGLSLDIKLETEYRVAVLLSGVCFAYCSLSNALNVIDQSRKVNRDSKELSTLQVCETLKFKRLETDVQKLQKDFEALREQMVLDKNQNSL